MSTYAIQHTLLDVYTTLTTVNQSTILAWNDVSQNGVYYLYNHMHVRVQACVTA